MYYWIIYLKVTKHYIDSNFYPYSLSEGYKHFIDNHAIGIRTVKWNYIVDINPNEKSIVYETEELFDLEADYHEVNNIISMKETKDIIAVNHFRKLINDYLDDTNNLNIPDHNIENDSQSSKIEQKQIKDMWIRLGYMKE